MKHVLKLIAIVAVASIALFGCDLFKGPEGPQGPPGENAGDLKSVPPDCSAGTLKVKIASLGWNLRGSDGFPSITIVGSVKDSAGNFVNGLVAADFWDVIDEDGTAMWPLTVKELAAVTTTTKVDIVFVLDTTGSMSGAITGVKNNIVAFASSLTTSGLNWRIGCVTFGDNMGNTKTPRAGYSVYPTTQDRKYQALTSNITTFQTFVNGLVADGGDDGPENQIDALSYAVEDYIGKNPEGSYQLQSAVGFRADAKRVFILITDVDFHTPASTGNVDAWYANGGPYGKSVYNTVTDLIVRLQAYGATVHTVSGTSGYSEYKRIADSTGGLTLSIGGSYATILSTLSSAIANNYVVTYMTSNPALSTTRTVRWAAHTATAKGQDTKTYTSPAALGYPLSALYLSGNYEVPEFVPAEVSSKN